MKTQTSKEQEQTSLRQIFSVRIAGSWFGLPIANVRTVFSAQRITPIPLAPITIAGLVNVRGDVLTAINVAAYLNSDDAGTSEKKLLVGIEHRSEQFGLLIESAGEILDVTDEMRVPTPVRFGSEKTQRTLVTYKVADKLIPILDIQELLDSILHSIAQKAA